MAGDERDWVVKFNSDAVFDLEDLKSKGDRKAVYEVVQKLGLYGPSLSVPHMKSLKGESDLFELRPKSGSIAARLIYARLGDQFVILAVAARKARFDRAVGDARVRLSRYLGGR